MAENKIVTGMKEALEHAKEHAGCEHLNKEEYGTGRWRCPDCGCVIYKSYADYCDC